MNTSICSCSSTSTTSVDLLSFVEEHNRKDDSFLTEISDEGYYEDDEVSKVVEEVSEEEEEEDEPDREPIILEITSFPTNPTVSDSSVSTASIPPKLPPNSIDVRHRHHRRHQRRSHTRHSHSSSIRMEPKSSPYAQLCIVPGQKTLVTMLELNVLNGRRRPRLPLDMPTPEDFPWLHEPTSSFTSTISSLSNDACFTSRAHAGPEKVHCEPIVLSGPWMLEGSMTQEEEDIYWLLQGDGDGEDVWVNFDDGCGKVLKKVWTTCITTGQWKLKRGTHQQHHPPGSPSSDAREEKRFRYSILS